MKSSAHMVWEANGLDRHSVPNAFLAGRATIANNPLVAAAIAAVLKGGAKAPALLGGWTVDGDGRVVYRHVGKKRGEILAYFELGEGAEERRTARPIEDQWAFVKSLNPLTADVMIMALAQLCDPSRRGKPMYPSLMPVSVTANSLLRYKRFTRWGRERSQCRTNIQQEMRRLQKLRFDVRQYPGWDVAIQRWNPRGVGALGDRLFEVVDANEIRGAISTDRVADLAWLIRPGQWAQWWLNAQGKVWTSAVPGLLVTLDHRRNRGIDVLAKKIGLNMLLLWGAVRSRYEFERRIDHLLEDIGELPVHGARDCHWAGRLRERFDEAMLRLRENGIFAEVSWPGGHGPGDPDRNKGWVDHWLAARVHIRRPGLPIIEREVSAQRVGAAKRRRKKPPQAISQLSFAYRMGVSTSYLSQIETGKRAIIPTMQLRLQPWIAASEPAT